MGLCGLVHALAARTSGVYIQHLEYTAASAIEADPAEIEWARDMIPSRRAQFAAGRWCARAALRALGRDRCPIPADRGGVPVWPEGVVGSISHKPGASVAAVAATATCCVLGLDLELDEPLDDCAIADVVLTHTESRHVREIGWGRWGLASPATLVLCAKEAVYKAVYPSVRIEFDWDDLELRFDPPSRCFSVVWLGEMPHVDVRGAFEIGDGWLLAAALGNQ
ncbi:hypothetical protein BE04_48970 [Sorangium cellulosum]|uniref:Enterobactin synthase component D n=1 Tax=Sorangium cellulosum TaxID=56 RepID=A0A150P0E4_SORCE|nr:hypothetical protein BE04_48970 [Sorangium cellulosum]